MEKVNGCTKLMGLVSLGQEHDDMNSLCLKGTQLEHLICVHSGNNKTKKRETCIIQLPPTPPIPQPPPKITNRVHQIPQPAVQALFWRRTLDNKSGSMPPSWMVDRQKIGAEARWGWGVGGGTKIFFLPLPLPLAHFPLNAYSLGKYFLAPSLHSYQIQDGGLNTKMCTRASKIRLHCRLQIPRLNAIFFIVQNKIFITFLQVLNKKRYNWPAMSFSLSSLATLDSVFLLPIGQQGRWIQRHFTFTFGNQYQLASSRGILGSLLLL